METATTSVETLYAKLLELATSSEAQRVWLYELLIARGVFMLSTNQFKFGYLPMGTLSNAFNYIEALLANLAALEGSGLHTALENAELDRVLELQALGNTFVMTLMVSAGSFSITFMFKKDPT